MISDLLYYVNLRVIIEIAFWIPEIDLILSGFLMKIKTNHFFSHVDSTRKNCEN